MSAATRSCLQCRNCGAEAPERYCARCGQETSEHLPSAGEFLHEWLKGVVETSIFVCALIPLRAVYRAPWWQTVPKGAAVGVAYLATLSAATVLMAGWALVA
jgi:hypothetical protein